MSGSAPAAEWQRKVWRRPASRPDARRLKQIVALVKQNVAEPTESLQI
jgi:hypothetical protein